MDQRWKIFRRDVLKGIAVTTAAPTLLLRPRAATAAGFPGKPIRVVRFSPALTFRLGSPSRSLPVRPRP